MRCKISGVATGGFYLLCGYIYDFSGRERVGHTEEGELTEFMVNRRPLHTGFGNSGKHSRKIGMFHALGMP